MIHRFQCAFSEKAGEDDSMMKALIFDQNHGMSDIIPGLLGSCSIALRRACIIIKHKKVIDNNST